MSINPFFKEINLYVNVVPNICFQDCVEYKIFNDVGGVSGESNETNGLNTTVDVDGNKRARVEA